MEQLLLIANAVTRHKNYISLFLCNWIPLRAMKTTILISLALITILSFTLLDSHPVKLVVKEMEPILGTIIQVLFFWYCVLSCTIAKIPCRKLETEFLCPFFISQSSGNTGLRMIPNFTTTTKAPTGKGSWLQRPTVTPPTRERIDKAIAIRNDFDDLIVSFSKEMELHMRTKFGAGRTVDLNMSAFLEKMIGEVQLNAKFYPDIPQEKTLKALCYLRLMRNSTAHILLSQFEEKERITWFLSAVLVVAGKDMINAKTVYKRAEKLMQRYRVTPTLNFPTKWVRFTVTASDSLKIEENCSIKLTEEEITKAIVERNSLDRLIVNISRAVFKDQPTVDLDLPAFLETITEKMNANQNPYPKISKGEVLAAIRVLREMRNATEHILLSKIVQKGFKSLFLSKVLIFAGVNMLNDPAICKTASSLLEKMKKEGNV